MQAPHRIPASELFQFVAACALLAASSAAVRLLPFRALVGTMGWGRGPSSSPEQVAQKAMIALRRAAARVPWRTACFDRGLAAHWLMRWQGVPSTLHYGIDPGGDELSAHVWVSFGGRILIGEDEAARHAEVAHFPAQAANRKDEVI